MAKANMRGNLNGLLSYVAFNLFVPVSLSDEHGIDDKLMPKL